MRDKIMQTKVLRVDPVQPEEKTIEQAANMLRRGELVVFPTETVYGLGADALQPGAVEQIFIAKGRPFYDPLIVHIADLDALERLVREVPESARELAKVFWPGPLTLILPASPEVPRLVTAGLDTVAVRMPRHPIAQALIRATGSPIAAPSANRFKHVSPTTAQHVLADLAGRIPLILDGGACEVGVESTVLDLCAAQPTILRPGGVSLEEIREILSNVQLLQARKQSDTVTNTEQDEQEEQLGLVAPGQMRVHYAPAVPTILFEGSIDEMHGQMLGEVERYQRQGQQVGVLIADEDLPAFQISGARIYTLGSSLTQVATRLFDGLRSLEEAEVQVILCRNFSEEGLGRAVRDRLLKACGGKIFKKTTT